MIAFSRRWFSIALRYVALPLALVLIILLAGLRLWVLPHLDDWNGIRLTANGLVRGWHARRDSA